LDKHLRRLSEIENRNQRLQFVVNKKRSGNIKNVGTTILSGWINEKQKVHVKNDRPINYKTGNNSEGWHRQWMSLFTNITYELEYYKLNFDVGDRILNSDRNFVDVIYGRKIGELPEVSVEVYETFDGWYYEGKKFTAETIYDYREDVTVIPKIMSKEMHITLCLEGGSGVTSVVAKYGEKLPEIDKPTREGWDFKGYFTLGQRIDAS
jgi:hypothetical protein